LTRPSAAPTIAVVDADHPNSALLAAGREVESLAAGIEPLRVLGPNREAAVRRAEIGGS